MDIHAIIRSIAHGVRTQGVTPTFRSLFNRARLRWSEWRYGIHTDAVIELSEFGIHNKEYLYYSPTDYSEFGGIMRALSVDPRQHVFLDYGCGMGRAMILAATYGFERVLGVEITADLANIARKNIGECRKQLRCSAIEVTVCDANQFDIPSDVTIFYFNNPFFGGVLANVLNKIQAFAKLSSSPVLIVCNLPPQSPFEEQILKQTWLKKINEGPLPTTGRHYIIFSPADSFGNEPTGESARLTRP